MATVFDVADYFLAKTDLHAGDAITNLKLQKLVYYAQGFSLALMDRPLFAEPFEAWQQGPVCPALHDKYQEHHNSSIPPALSPEKAKEAFNQEEIELLEEVYEALGCFSPWKLRDISHQEKAWQNAYNCCGSRGSDIISHEAMKESCAARLK